MNAPEFPKGIKHRDAVHMLDVVKKLHGKWYGRYTGTWKGKPSFIWISLQGAKDTEAKHV